MPTRDHFEWPFLEPRHRDLAARLETWSGDNLAAPHGADTDAACRTLVRQLGDAGWLQYATGGPTAAGSRPGIDTRAICVLRETLAWHSGLADFAFAMQGLGSGAITLFGDERQKQRYVGPAGAGRAIAAFALS